MNILFVEKMNGNLCPCFLFAHSNSAQFRLATLLCSGCRGELGEGLKVPELPAETGKPTASLRDNGKEVKRLRGRLWNSECC